MTKSEFLEKMAQKLGDKKQAQKAYDAFLETLEEEMQKPDGSMIFQGFGKFSVVQRKERTGRNPATGATIQIPAKKAVVFHASSSAQAKVNA